MLVETTSPRCGMLDTLEVMATDKKQPDTDNARIAKAIMAKVRVVAAHRNISTTRYLNEVLAAPVDGDYDAAIALMSKERASKTRKRD